MGANFSKELFKDEGYWWLARTVWKLAQWSIWHPQKLGMKFCSSENSFPTVKNGSRWLQPMYIWRETVLWTCAPVALVAARTQTDRQQKRMGADVSFIITDTHSFKKCSSYIRNWKSHAADGKLFCQMGTIPTHQTCPYCKMTIEPNQQLFKKKRSIISHVTWNATFFPVFFVEFQRFLWQEF